MSFSLTGLTPLPSNLHRADVFARQCDGGRHHHHQSLAIDVRVFECPRNSTKLALAFHQFLPIENLSFRTKCVGSGSISKTIVEESGDLKPRIVYDNGDDGGSDGGGDSYGGGGGGGNGGGGGEEEEEFGPIMKFEEVMKEAEVRGVRLPSDMLEAANATGIRRAFLFR